ncbi:MAG TPA: HAD-IC family P-type ATPase [Acidimicrobiales bacterium]|nr:HAD-IC family P-type ATPase [Acidimicrobiales bacterium]
MSAPPLTPAVPPGLSGAEVEARVADGRVNRAPGGTGRSFGQIVGANVFTRFNALLGGLLVVILTVGPLQDALFGIVLVTNTAIGIYQEWKAKRTLDELTLLTAPVVTVVRDSERHRIGVEDVVEDDVVELARGAQVVADGRVLAADDLEVDESLLSGESVPLPKGADDRVLSGSFVTAGHGWYAADGVGPASYANQIAAEARRFSLVRSELRRGTDRILGLVTLLIVPTATLLVISQFSADHSLPEAVRGTVAGVVAMVPEGLVLLTSIAFTAGVLRLGRRGVLVQELAAIEGLARVDVVCTDKTGTITEPDLEVTEVVPLDGTGRADLDAVLGALAAADPDPNASSRALAAAFDPPGWAPTWQAAFSSARRWSGAGFGERGDWVLGAPSVLLDAAGGPDGEHGAGGEHGGDGGERDGERNGRERGDSGERGAGDGDRPLAGRATEVVDAQSRRGRRVLLLVRTGGEPAAGPPPTGTPVAVVAIEERVRANARSTLDYFGAQGVTVKVMSGDDARTVGAVAGRVGIDGADDPVDARELPTDDDALGDLVESTGVFGRVGPEQKQAMVRALQARGHTVAMTGDGVNDVLALKESDLGVAMGSGAPVSRSVAPVVLLDSDFAGLPPVLAEGRRVIANVERVANLFVTKTVYATLMALAVGVAHVPFPFLPRHLTIVSSLTIGIPAFFLALAPNDRRAVPGFVERVLRFAVPAGTLAAIATMSAYGLARTQDVSTTEARTAATITLFVVALWVLAILSRPVNHWRSGLVTAMAGLFVAVLLVPWTRHFFALDLPPRDVTAAAFAFGAGAAALLEVGWRATGWLRPNGR